MVNPTLAFKINEAVSVGFGIDFMYGKAELAKTPVNPADNTTNLYNLDLEGDGTAWGYNFGILVKATPNLRFGAKFRSPFTLEIKGGDVSISNILAPLRPAFDNSATASRKGTATINMPATAAFGVAYTTGRWTFEADADRTFWSSYQSLPITFDRTNTFLRNQNPQKNWKDVCAVRVGTEYRVTDPLALRLGFVYDPTPAPAETVGPELPDADRLNYMVGVGYKVGKWTVDFAGMYIDKKDRTITNIRVEDGSYVGQNRANADERQHAAEDADEEPVLQREINDLVQHGVHPPRLSP